jgi:hypothetical protein
MSEDDEEFSHTFRRYTRVLERQVHLAEKQLAITERELRKSHGLQFELESSELRVKLGQRIDEIRSHIEYLKSRPAPTAAPEYEYIPKGVRLVGLDGPTTTAPAASLTQHQIDSLEQHAKMLIEWAAHLAPDKVYVLSTHDWQTLFHQPKLLKEDWIHG